MVIGAGKIKLRLYDVASLKGKRSIVKSLIQRIKNNFNVSIGETDFNDSHDWAEIGFAIVGNDAGFVNSKMDKIINLAEASGLAMIADSYIELIHL
jgi:uncharacterized protein